MSLCELSPDEIYGTFKTDTTGDMVPDVSFPNEVPKAETSFP